MAVAQEASSAVRLEPAASVTVERLFQEHSGWLYGYCLRLLRSPEEAEDAVQATYLNACRSLKNGFEPRADSAWLLKVAQNVCITRLRSSGRRARVERLHDAELIEETVAAPERRADELIGLPEALASLPEQQRRAILLREWQGLSYREVAAKLKLSQAAVETLIFRARRSLAAALEDSGGRRIRRLHGLNLGGLAAGVKSLVVGGGAAKLATVAVVAATATVVATDPAGWHRPSAPSGRDVPTAPKLPAAPAVRSASTPWAPVGIERGALVTSGHSAGGGHGRALGRTKAREAHGKAGEHAKTKNHAQRTDQRGRSGEKARSRGPVGGTAGKPSFAGSGGPPPHVSAPARAPEGKSAKPS
jgi:RNA polymerase sigma factor (sigma-70 family)